MTATRIHHINFVVRDLDEASSKFETLLGLRPFEVHEHAARGPGRLELVALTQHELVSDEVHAVAQRRHHTGAGQPIQRDQLALLDAGVHELQR